jgi:methylated-DNA-protein-cysteine methyltransferase-like protein
MALSEKISEQNSDFFKRVWEVVKCIPKGRVTSYGAIAKYLGAARSARMVGWAMNASHSIKNIPAHRVVNRNGLLTGKMHFNPQNKMEKLLLKEGIKVKNDQVIGFKEKFWNPETELRL